MTDILKFIRYLTYYPLIRQYHRLPPNIKSEVNADIAQYLNKPSAAQKADADYSLLIRCLRSEYFRTIFYHRTGRLKGLFKNYKRPSISLMISPKVHLGGGIRFHHPYNTILNAAKIGKNFTFRHLTTIGNKFDGRNDLVPTIGDNVTCGANVIIIGNITIGNNVIIGAGSVVTKDIPANSIVAGNPARIIRRIPSNTDNEN